MSNAVELGKTKTLFPHDEWFQNVGQYYMLDAPELLKLHVHPKHQLRGYRQPRLHLFTGMKRINALH